MYQPDIPQNLGAAIRLSACLGVPLDVIRPAAFPLGQRDLARAAMDYRALADIRLHASWRAFLPSVAPGRLILLTTAGDQGLYRFAFRRGDVLLTGRESAGAPATVHADADARVAIPMADGARSLNVVVAAAIALGEALRQTGGS
jgi:tRNA (cytidine/uridine-2'-O-)-methyltransferase